MFFALQPDEEAQNGESIGGESSIEEEDSDIERRRRRKKKKQMPREPLAKTRARRQTRAVDYAFHEFDEMIQEAMEDLVVESKPKADYRGKPFKKGLSFARSLQLDMS